MRVGLAKVAIAGAAAKLLVKFDDNESAMIDDIFDLFAARHYDDALGVLDSLQHETKNGMKCTPYAFIVRTEIARERA